MAELERTLVSRGYAVSSWKAVEQLVAAERVSPLNAARQLGATVMLQVNSLERSKQDPLRELRWDFEFFESDAYGQKGPAVMVPEKRAQVLEGGWRASQAIAVVGERVSASINVTAVDVNTGRSMWFYSWNHWQPLDEGFSTQRLFLCNRRHDELCFLRTPKGQQPEEGSKRYRAGSKGSSIVGDEFASEVDAAYHRVTREVMESLVNHFAEWAS